MSKKFIGLCLAFLVCVGVTAQAEEGSLNRVVSEKLVGKINFSSWMPESLKVSPDSKRVAYVAWVGDRQFVVVDGKEGKEYDAIVGESLIFDAPGSIHYLVIKGSDIYLVKEKIE